VEPLVEKLVDMGADVNACNSFGYSCILEACHRGYIVVAKTLLKGGVDLAYIPNEEQAGNSPFASAPCQSALAEAARSGFFKVVQVGALLLLHMHSKLRSIWTSCHTDPAGRRGPERPAKSSWLDSAARGVLLQPH
jgi:hypothetical protein